MCVRGDLDGTELTERLLPPPWAAQAALSSWPFSARRALTEDSARPTFLAVSTELRGQREGQGPEGGRDQLSGGL